MSINPGRTPFTPDAALATSMGLDGATIARLMAELGFRRLAAEADGTDRWRWHGRPPAAKQPPARPAPDNAFAALADWRPHG